MEGDFGMSFDGTSLQDDVLDDEQPVFRSPDVRSVKGSGSFVSVEEKWGSFGDSELVGNGKMTNEYCAKFNSFWGCDRVDLHDRVTLDGANFKGKVYAHPVFGSCDKPSCPKCYKYGWAVREAHKIEVRLAEASRRFGLVEHIVATFPEKFYGLGYEVLRSKVVEVLKVRGIVGGILIFHGARYNQAVGWYWSPHFHVLGFILGGYGGCRGCRRDRKTECRGCGGFEDRKFRCFEKDGCIVRVLGKRKTVGGTAWYQLHHSTIRVGVKRPHVAAWFGVCSYRKLKVTVGRKKTVCPICQHDLKRLLYFGDRSDILACLGSVRSSCKGVEFYDDLVNDDGLPNWGEARSGSYGSRE